MVVVVHTTRPQANARRPTIELGLHEGEPVLLKPGRFQKYLSCGTTKLPVSLLGGVVGLGSTSLSPGRAWRSAPQPGVRCGGRRAAVFVAARSPMVSRTDPRNCRLLRVFRPVPFSACNWAYAWRLAPQPGVRCGNWRAAMLQLS